MAAVSFGLTGCLSGSPGADNDGDSPTASPTTGGGDSTSSGDEDEANFGIDHPAMTGAENDPVLGPPPNEAEMGFVLFSEPSCPYCRDFHEETWSRMKEELIAPGRLSYVYRPYPKVKSWAPQVAYGLLEVWNRDQQAFVAYMEHTYEHYMEYSPNPAETTATFLDKNTDVDGDGVAEVIENFGRVDGVSETMDAAKAAEMTTIPSYAILREGEVVDTAIGGQSYENIKRMLGAD